MSPSTCPLLLVALLASTGGARADYQCHSASIPSAATTWNSSVTVPRFDPNIGILQYIEITLAGTATGSAGCESHDATPSTVILTFASAITLRRPDNSVILVITPSEPFTENFSAYDGVNDFAGTSGSTHGGITANAIMRLDSPPPVSDLALFAGPAGNPGTITLPIKGEDASGGTGAGNLNLQITQQTAATVTVCYFFDPYVSRFCIGNGLTNGGLDCPCQNTAPSGSLGGCLNPTGAGGLLDWAGLPSIANDSVALTMSQLPAGVHAWFFKSDISSAGVVLGHGVNCLRGPLMNVQNMNVSGHVLPPPGQHLSTMLSASVGDVHFVQGYYRAPNDVCAGPVNTTNAVQIIWGN